MEGGILGKNLKWLLLFLAVGSLLLLSGCPKKMTAMENSSSFKGKPRVRSTSEAMLRAGPEEKRGDSRKTQYQAKKVEQTQPLAKSGEQAQPVLKKIDQTQLSPM